MQEEKIEFTLTRSIQTTVTTYATWLRRYFNQIIQKQKFSVFSSNQSSVFVNNVRTILDSDPNIVNFEVEVENTVEEGPQGENKTDVIVIITTQNKDNVLVKTNFYSKIYYDLVSTLLIDSINSFPISTDQNLLVSDSTEEERDSSDDGMINAPMSENEKRILKLWKKGFADSNIAGIMGLSPGRIRNIVSDLRKRFGNDVVPFHSKKIKKRE